MNESCKDEISSCAYNCADNIFKLHQDSNRGDGLVEFESFIADSFVPKLGVMNDNFVVLESFIADRTIAESNLMEILKSLSDFAKHIGAQNVVENSSESAAVDDHPISAEEGSSIEIIKSSYKSSISDNIRSSTRLTTKNKRFFESELWNISCDALTKIVQIILS